MASSKKYPQFTDEHDMFRKSLRDFVVKELAPHAEEWEQERLFPREVFEEMGKLGPQDESGRSFHLAVGVAGEHPIQSDRADHRAVRESREQILLLRVVPGGRDHCRCQDGREEGTGCDGVAEFFDDHRKFG